MESYSINLTEAEICLLIDSMRCFENDMFDKRRAGNISDDMFDHIEDTFTAIATKFGAATGMNPEEIFD